MVLLNERGLWKSSRCLEDCIALFVFAMCFRIFGKSSPTRSFLCSPFSNVIWW